MERSLHQPLLNTSPVSPASTCTVSPICVCSNAPWRGLSSPESLSSSSAVQAGSHLSGKLSPRSCTQPVKSAAPYVDYSTAVLSAFAIELVRQGVAPGVIILLLTVLGILAGLLQILIGFLGVGKLIKYIPYPVVSGYLTGVGLIIIGSQLQPFSATSFKQGAFVDITEKDVLGKWAVFFFYPADFTFVCPTELEDMADQYATPVSISSK